MYYEQLITSLTNNKTFSNCLSTIINPFSLYYLCDHYYGNEIKQYNIPIPENKHDLLKTHDITKINDYDIIHCQVNYFSKFCNEILDKINKKIILTTGQWHLPQIRESPLTEKVLSNEYVILWVSQNPIYDNKPKYLAFPYGITHQNIQVYADLLTSTHPLEKTDDIVMLPLDYKTHPCRVKLPFIDKISPLDYYMKMRKAKFIISPIGDRDDCYRHYEAIGLGTIPISNVSSFYRNIFTKNMIYVNIDDIVKIVNNTQKLTYNEPNKDLICFEYHQDVVLRAIEHLKK